MSSSSKGNSHLLRNATIAVVLIIIVAIGGYVAFVMSAGSGEVSADVADVAPTLEASDATSETTLYQIEQAGSEARFYIDEDLRGERVTVLGVTNQVGGQITVDTATPANSQIGAILINARALETDQGQRNRALRSFILRSAEDAYEFITFQPTSLVGLPESITVGEAVTFQIVGDLTIVDTTQSVTFDATVTLGSDNNISGLATATIQYSAYGLTIPSVPFVANVSDDVRIELEFVATPVSGS